MSRQQVTSKEVVWNLIFVSATYILLWNYGNGSSSFAIACVVDAPSQCTHTTSNGEVLPCYITENEGGCPDNLYPPVAWHEIPNKPQDVSIVAFRSSMPNGPGSDVIAEYPSVNITWTLDLKQNPTWIKGIQIAITGLTNHHKFKHSLFNEIRCFTFDLSTADLTKSDVANLSYYFDCFRQLSPSSRYAIMVRTLPLPESLRHDVTRSSTMVWKTETTPSCSSPMSENFYECNLKPIGGYEAAYWTPNTMETDIKDYNDVTVHFDLPPEEYNLDIVTIYIFRHDSTSCNTRKSLIFFKDVRVGDADTYTLSVNQTGENRTMLDFTAHNISGGQYCAGIRPNPSRRQACKSGPGRSLVICTMTISPPFTILDDPCERKPCGEHGQCKSSGSGYSCDCSPGYIVHDGYCQENACFRNPCGQNGTCRTVIGRSNYNCTCSEGFEMYEGRCTADPCRSNSSAMCGQFGICVPSLELNNFNCQCHDGYDVIDGFCRVSVPSLTYIAIASIGGTLTGIALLVPFTLWMIRKRRKRRQDLPSGLSIQLAKNNAKYNEVTRPMIHVESDCVRPELLLLYSKDCSRHVDVVECFARFLEIRFGCKVHLDLWQTMEIAAAKTEWLFKKLKTVDKIVVIASRGTRERWDERCDGESFKKSSRVTDDFLTSALNIISSDFNLRERSERFGKYVTVYFEYSDISDVPEPLRIMGSTFELLRSMESFYFCLRNVNGRSLKGHCRIAELKETILTSEEGEALQEAVKLMREYKNTNFNWYSDCGDFMSQEGALCECLPNHTGGDSSLVERKESVNTVDGQTINLEKDEEFMENPKPIRSVSFDEGYHSVQNGTFQISDIGERDEFLVNCKIHDNEGEQMRRLLTSQGKFDPKGGMPEIALNDECVEYCKLSWHVPPDSNIEPFYYVEPEISQSQMSLTSSEFGALAVRLNSKPI